MIIPVPYGRTVDLSMCMYASCAKFWGLKFDKHIHKCSIVWSFSMTTLFHVLQCWLLQFFNNIPGKCSTIPCTVLSWVPWIITYSQNSRNSSGRICFSDLSELFSAMTRVIWWLNKIQLLWNRKAAGTLANVHFMWEDYTEELLCNLR